MASSVCIAVLNYNGVSHLETLLPTLRRASELVPARTSLVVLDNVSTDGDVDWLRQQHPWVRTAIAERNQVLFSYNKFLATLEDEIVVLLNNDLRVREDFLAPLLSHFRRPDVFGVSATSRDWDDTSFTCGPVRLRSHHGIYYWDFERSKQILSHTLFCSGACMAVDRRKFLELGGFNRLFYPAYGEDLDLGFRAWRRGWRCVFEPASVVYHRENASFDTSEGSRSKQLMQRAQFLFQWASLPPAGNWFERTAMQMVLAWRHWRAGDKNWAATWVKTWIEWQRLRKDFRWMKVSSQELERICGEIDAAVINR